MADFCRKHFFGVGDRKKPCKDCGCRVKFLRTKKGKRWVQCANPKCAYIWQTIQKGRLILCNKCKAPFEVKKYARKV